ncbi:MAG: alpha/beta fold hydrolase [Bacteroidetes bacterium]|nr:alpha/beta fold hydrolase [Bacteroidota bacterium]
MIRNPLFASILLLLLMVHCQSESGGAARHGSDAASGRAVHQAAGSARQPLDARGGGENVQFTTADGVVITGTLYAAGEAAPTVLCLHQWRSDRTSFAALAAQLQQAGMTVLAIDMRGYGGSTKTAAGKSIRPDRKAQEDIRAALQFLKKHRAVDGGRIGIIGASYGSSNALIYAAGDAGIRALILLSPGLNYFNELPTEGPLRKYKGRPLLAVASSEDLRSMETVQVYQNIAPGILVKTYDGAGHGTDILKAGVGLEKEILAFLRKNL